jgi:hypothetical protein
MDLNVLGTEIALLTDHHTIGTTLSGSVTKTYKTISEIEFTEI